MDRIQKSSKVEGSSLKRSSSVSNNNNRNNSKQTGEMIMNTKYDSGSDNEETKENKKDMANYFTSLNKIEETIKFMEEKILCEKKNKTEIQKVGKDNEEEGNDYGRLEMREDKIVREDIKSIKINNNIDVTRQR